jgi:PKD repeat protein
VDLVFNYSGEESALAWFDDGTSCRFSESSTDPALYDQPQLFYYVNGYVGPDPLLADFIATAVSQRADFDTTVLLTDQTTGSPHSSNWTLSPSTYYFVEGTSASSQNPVVKFTSNGVYTVTLIVTRGNSAGIKVRTDYMYIGIPGLWTGLTSGDWNTGSNWHNFQVPDASLSITIPEDAINWPHITGDLNIGSLCENIILDGESQLVVDGDLIIAPGSTLSFTGDGKIILGGDWDNSGTFSYGEGTIEFSGTEDATLRSQGVPQDFYKIRITKDPGTLYLQGTVNVIGNID